MRLSFSLFAGSSSLFATSSLSSLLSLALMSSSPHSSSAFVVLPTKSASSSISSVRNIIPTRHQHQQQRANMNILRMASDDYDDIDDEDYDPLEDGVDSVSWLPSLASPSFSSSTVTNANTDSNPDSVTEILPFFPLGGIVYTPNSEHVLNIFEPRYRQMYNDILMNGSKRFIVSMSHPNLDGTFATTGVIFQLEDLKEVSEMTEDRVKYICNHKVTERVQLGKVVNPEVWETRETYLKVEATVLYEDEVDGSVITDKEEVQRLKDRITAGEDDDDEEEEEEDNNSDDENDKETDIYRSLVNASPSKSSSSSSSSSSTTMKKKKSTHEIILIASFQNLVDKQHEAEEDVRFTRTSIDSLAVAPGGGEDGLWQTIRLWQSFIDQRLVARQNEMQREFQEKLLEFLKKEKGISEKELPSAIGFNDLSPALQKEVQDLQKRMNVELQPLVLESTLTIQKILEAKDHKARCLLLKHFIDVEKKRLDAKCTLKKLSAGDASAVTEEESDGQEQGQEGQGKKAVLESSVSGGSSTDGAKSKATSAKDDSLPPPSQGALLVDEPDAFQ